MLLKKRLSFVLNFCPMCNPLDCPNLIFSEKKEGKKLIGNEIVTVSRDEQDQVHLYVLHNDNEVESFVEMHKAILRGENQSRNENWIVREHNQSFKQWFKDQIYSKFHSDPASISDRLRCLAYGPSSIVFSYRGYAINGYTFYNKEQDEKSTMQNSGATVVAEAMHISSMKDLNPKYENLSYFGVINHIWVFDYEKFHISIFDCKWVHDNTNLYNIFDVIFIDNVIIFI